MPARKKPARPVAVPPAPAAGVPDIAALTAMLQAHALGQHEMTASQVNVALALLKIFGVQDSHSATPRSHEDALADLA